MRTPPRPVSYATSISFLLKIIPPKGKSGPLIYFNKSVTIDSGLSKSSTVASTTSPKLCGGIFVAIPTAIPSVPFKSKFGTLVGNTFGSVKLPSKLGIKSTVSFSISASKSEEIFCILASVYLYAAGESPSTDPKLPCPQTKGYL